ncbi:hypothetical protein GWO43_05555 [candidate division KSB1 bacterium]|nr:hypothetical protein [candidate division KSB1 bacterium]NIV70188.1 hypothetical protein [Phycisphaerae bacterium]NIS23451.1 hypothetical protein [candidate division KSB1 bacterium]NIT70359.1 hypothetical protein [candidate division KSB1 bacterium]NIW68430.1 hypothetical protein [candidate division KSB1 bacterium]
MRLTIRHRYIPTTPAKSISVLRHALTADNKEMQQQITDWVESGGNLDWRAPNGWTLLHLSAQCGNESMIRFLIEHGADIESRAEYGETPLMLACDYRWTDAKIDPSVVKTLLDLGANPNAENHDGRTALSFIFLLDTPEGKEITALLKERGALQIPGISATCPECGAPESSQMRERGVRVTFNGVFAEFPCPGCGVEEQVDRDTIDKRQGVQVLCPSCGVVAHIPPSVWCKTCGSGLSTGWQSSVKKA